jgi:putative oxidoreductase
LYWPMLAVSSWQLAVGSGQSTVMSYQHQLTCKSLTIHKNIETGVKMNQTGPGNYHDIAILILRLGVGVVFILAGWGKLTGIEGTVGFFGDIGIPAPGIMAWVVGIVEFFGGIMVLTGTYIRIPALLLATVMLVAIISTKLDRPFNAMRLDLMLLLMNLALALLNSGRYSIDRLLSGRK